MGLFKRNSKLRRNIALVMSVLMLCSAFPMSSVYATDEVATQPITEPVAEETVITVPNDSQEVVVTPAPEETDDTTDDTTNDTSDDTTDDTTGDTSDNTTDDTTGDTTDTPKNVEITVPENQDDNLIGYQDADGKIWFNGTQGSFAVKVDGGFDVERNEEGKVTVINDFEVIHLENIDYIVDYDEDSTAAIVTMKCKDDYNFSGETVVQKIKVFGKEYEYTFYIDSDAPEAATEAIIYSAEQNGSSAEYSANEFDSSKQYQSVLVKVPVSEKGAGIKEVSMSAKDDNQSDTTAKVKSNKKKPISTWVENSKDSEGNGVVYHCFNAESGEKEYNIKLTDNVGNIRTIVTKKIIVDTVAPTEPSVTFKSEVNADTWYKSKKEIKVTGVEKGCKCVVTLNGDEVYSNDECTSTSISVTPEDNKYDQGKNTYIVTITDPAGNYVTAEKSFNFDTVPPMITKYEIEKAESTTDKILTFLSFGIYSNTNIKVTVYATDNASGVSDIRLFNNFVTEIHTENKFNNGKKTFTINAKEDKYILSADCVDNAENQSKKISLSKAKFDGDIAKGFEVVVTDGIKLEQNVIEVATNTGTKYHKQGENDCYSGNVTFSFKAEDDLVGISSIQVTLNCDENGNPNDVTELCVDENGKELPTRFNAVEDTTKIKAEVPSEAVATVPNQKVTSKEIFLDTSKTSLYTEGVNTITVTVTNNVGESYSKKRTIYLEANPPEVTGEVKCNATENTTDYVDSEGKHWYSGNVTFNGTAKAAFSGIKSVTVTLNNSEVPTDKYIVNGGTTYKGITLNTANVPDFYHEGENNLIVTVTDNFDKKTIYTETFYLDTTKPALAAIVKYDERLTKYYKESSEESSEESVEKHWYSGDVTFNVTAENTGSKIKSVAVELNGTKLQADQYTVEDNSAVEGNSTDKTITVNTADVTNHYHEGENTLKVVVTDNLGRTSKIEKVIYLDKTKPQITKYKVEKAENSADRILTFLTFGIYSNDKLNVTVYAKDPYVDSENTLYSGVKTITFYNNGVEESKSADNGTGNEYSATFTIEKVGDCNKYDLSASCIDNLQNQGAKIKLSDASNLEDGFEVVIVDDGCSTIQDFEIKVTANVTENNETKYYPEETPEWYSGDVTFEFTAEDKIVGISSIKVELNETDVTGYCKENGVTLPTQFNEVATVPKVDLVIPSEVIESAEAAQEATAAPTEATEAVTEETTDEATEAVTEDITEEATAAPTEATEAVTEEATAVQNNKVTSKTITLDTSDLKTSDLYSNCYHENDNTLKVTVTNNLGKEESFTRTIYRDTTPATIDGEVTYDDKETTHYNDSENRNWYSGDVTFNVTANDAHSGISSVVVKLNDNKVPTDQYSVDDDVTENGLPCKKITLNTAKVTDFYKDGDNTLTVYVTDNVGNTSDFKQVIYLDKTKSQITKYVVSKANDKVTNKILTFLTFGIYSNDKLKVTVYAEDPYVGDKSKKFCSGVKNITLYNGESSLGTVNVTQEQNSGTGYSYYAEFTIDANADNKYILSAECTDNVGNKSENVKLSDAKFNIDIAKDFEVVVADTKHRAEFATSPQGDKIKVTPNATTTSYKKNVENSVQNWYSGDVTYKFTATDDLVGISSIQVMFNGQNVTTSCVDEDNKMLPTKFNAVEDTTKVEATVPTTKPATIENKKVNTKTVTLNTANVSEHCVEGPNTFKVVVTNNVGNTSEAECVIYFDKTSPRITGFEFAPEGIYEGEKYTDPETGEISDNSNYKSYAASMIQETTYGFYFKTDTTVTVQAADKDEQGDVAGSGVKYIYFWCVSKDGELLSYSPIDVNGEASAYFTVDAGFKGRIYAFAVDNVNNSINRGNPALNNNNFKALKGVEPDGVVLETLAQHNNDARVSISRPQATKTTASGSPLYNNTVNLNLEAYDPHSGIKQITYTIEGTNPSPAKNYIITDTLSIDLNGGISYSDYAATWGNKSTDGNLVTYLSTTIPVNFNCDNIKVTLSLTDRAGYTSTATDSFSIDTVNPEITVEYVPNELKDGVYCKTRKATVTVKERNFDASLVNCSITNTDGYIPKIEWIKTEGVGDDMVNIGTINYNHDGDYVFDISCEDRAGNKSESKNHAEFTVDNTAPTIVVHYDNNTVKNTRYFNKDRVATITITEHNFHNNVDPKSVIKLTAYDPKDNSKTITAPEISKWNHVGSVHTATVKFEKDGYYSLNVEYTDLADNKATDIKLPEPKSFYIDKTKPQLEIIGVQPNKAYNEMVTPIVKMSDDNYDSKGYTVTFDRIDIKAKDKKLTASNTPVDEVHNEQDGTVTFNTLGDVTGKDDSVYMMKAVVTDKAGNSSEQTLNFSMNRLGSQYVYSETAKDHDKMEEMLKSGYRSYNTASDIIIEEINVSPVNARKITMTVDGGSYRELVENTDYTVVDKHDKPNSWHKYIYTIPKEIFKEDGYYTIVLSTGDEAGNESDNKTPKNNEPIELSFTIDNIKPNISIIGLVDKTEEGDGYLEGELLAETSKEVQVICEDTNIDINSFDIYLNDKKLERDSKDGYTIEKDAYTITARLTVYAAPDRSAQTLRVVARDLAENENENSVNKFVLSATLLMRFFNNPVLVILTAALLVAVTVTVIIIIAKKKRRNA